ncbi:MAG: ABC transporter ATP-binding protein [Deltaproteobacteria bacterium]|nr:ABC transporter ATP-binding protein [Deltaproteobacteria bacterium]
MAVPRAGRDLFAVDGVSFDLMRGRTLALIGESGCGKTLTALALMGLLDPPLRSTGGGIRLRDDELLAASPARFAEVRGRRIAMVFQEARAALDPLVPVGEQVAEPLRLHKRMTRRAARAAAVQLLADVGMAGPSERYHAYAHELSGGTCQRVTIAMALAGEPDVLIADEPTSQLDVTMQAQILDLLRRLKKSRRLALLFISHDLAVVESIADDIAVMYAGRIVEHGTTESLRRGARHPYTRALWALCPSRAKRDMLLNTIPGQMPSLADRPLGCPFHPRCSARRERCSRELPRFDEGVACFYPYDARS